MKPVFLYAVMLVAALLTACGGGSGGDGGSSGGGGGGGSEHRPGLGKSTDTPEGLPLELPEGLMLESPIYGYAPEDPWKCDDKYDDEAYGHGALVRLCLIFNNTTGEAITVNLPPGLLFVSRNLQVQNGILTQRISFEVPAGTRFFAPIFMYCTNSPRRSSSDQDEYDVGPVTQYEDFQELFSLLADKSISREMSGAIQVMVHHLERGEGLNAHDRAVIASM